MSLAFIILNHCYLQKSECPENMERIQRNLVGFLMGWVHFRTREAEMEETKNLFGKNLIELLQETNDIGEY